MHKDILSSTSCIIADVPQSSVLGPLLFILYVNDVSKNMLSFCRLFADDNCIQYSSQNVSCIGNNINHDLLALEQWSSKWLLTLTQLKPRLSFLHRNQVIFFQHCQLEDIPTHKHLGLLILSGKTT